jgi:D-alanyl-D-alanine carboxypeptidase
MIPGQGLWQGTSGVSHSGVNITPGMYLGIGSSTKTFMSALALKLAEMNVINLEDSLYKWIPRFAFVDSTITIRQLLNHTSGIFSISEKPGYADSILANPNRHWSPEEVLNTFLSTPYFPKGQSFRYSNTNYIILGMIIRHATGTQVSTKLNELILDPLGLDYTFLAVEEIVPDTIAHPWANGIDINATPRTSLLSAAWTAGAMYSSSENTSKWYQMLFGGQVVSQASLTQMLTFTQQSDLAYGLGVTRYNFNGRILFGHSGDIRGYTSSMLYDTAMKMSITVLVNQLGINPVAIAASLLNTVIRNPLAGQFTPETIVKSFELEQNFPNPFNPSTKIRYGLETSSFITIRIHDITGKQISELINKRLSVGSYVIDFLADDLPAGIYFCTLYADGIAVATKKLALVK